MSIDQGQGEKRRGRDSKRLPLILLGEFESDKDFYDRNRTKLLLRGTRMISSERGEKLRARLEGGLEDIVHDSFLAVPRKKLVNLDAYLMETFQNKFLNFRRECIRIIQREPAEYDIVSWPNPLKQAEAIECWEAIDQAVREKVISPESHKVLSLFFGEDYRDRDIKATENIRWPGKVRQRDLARLEPFMRKYYPREEDL